MRKTKRGWVHHDICQLCHYSNPLGKKHLHRSPTQPKNRRVKFGSHLYNLCVCSVENHDDYGRISTAADWRAMVLQEAEENARHEEWLKGLPSEIKRLERIKERQGTNLDDRINALKSVLEDE